jgi:predicted metal-binding membrane protein
VVVLGSIAAVTALAWLYLVVMAAGMTSMADMARLRPWTGAEAVMMFIMWAVMMVGMMLPSATPMVLLYARVCRKSLDMAAPDTGAFVMGYVAVWTLFSAAATALQWGLEQAALLSPTMTSASPFFAGMVLVLAGLYQWTPAKQACLSRCRSPVEFLSTHWRPGAGGAFAMGLRHGAFCVGCCWALMALLFVGGVMNLLWVALITIFILLEKVVPFGHGVGKTAGALLALAGLAVIVAA